MREARDATLPGPGDVASGAPGEYPRRPDARMIKVPVTWATEGD